MAFIDVFNGDADGICALRQLRLAEPREARHVTGLKRDIALLARVQAAAGDTVTVLDISLDRNRAALEALLAAGARVRYFDHHYAGDIPAHPLLEATIEPSGCTSALVDRHLGGRFRDWAVAGAFGDGFGPAARLLARQAGFADDETEALRALGVAINYNAYGESAEDVMVHPAELYRLASLHERALDFARGEPVVRRLRAQQEEDLAAALQLPPLRSGPGYAAFAMPDLPWSRRVSGTFATHLAGSRPDIAFAVLTPRRDGGYLASVRCAEGRGPAAMDFCRGHGGGGRLEAGGIDRIEEAGRESFLDAFEAAYATPRAPAPSFRPLGPGDQEALWDLLHVALWDPPPAGPRPREVLEHPEVRIYAEDWGSREGDVGVMALVDGEPAGACWMRVVKGGRGLSYIDDETPQLGIALFPRYQHQGRGEPLMRAALEAARRHGFRKVALSVHPENPARKVYLRCGFRQVDVRRTYLVMVAELAPLTSA